MLEELRRMLLDICNGVCLDKAAERMANKTNISDFVGIIFTLGLLAAYCATGMRYSPS
jgi:hypothetical protein